MRLAFADLLPLLRSRQFWVITLKFGLIMALAATLFLAAFAAFLVVLPFALGGGLALHLYLRRKLRHARGQASSQPPIIEGQYTVLKR